MFQPSDQLEASNIYEATDQAFSLNYPREVRALGTSFIDQWQALVEGSDNLYRMYQSPQWWEHLVATHPADDLRLFVATSANDEVVGISPVQFQALQLSFQLKSRSLLRLSVPAVTVLGGRPLLPERDDFYDRYIASLLNSFPQCEAIYLKSVPQETHCWSYFSSGGNANGKVLVYSPEGTRPFHGIRLPSTFEQYLSKFSRKKRYNLKRQERLLAEHGKGMLELIRIDSPQQVATFSAAAAAIEMHAWQVQRTSARIVDNDETRATLTDLAERGLLRSYLLRCGRDFCAYVLGYQYHDVFHYADIAFDDRLAKFSPGAVLLYLLIADLIEHRPVVDVNLGAGHSAYKQQCGTWHSRDREIFLLRNTLLNRSRVAAHATYRSAIERTKTVLRAINSKPERTSKGAAVAPELPKNGPPRRSGLNRPVRVCFMLDKFSVAGIETQLLLLLSTLDRAKVEPSVCLLDGRDSVSRSMEPTGVPLLRLGVQHLSRVRNLKSAVDLARFLRRERIDVLHPLFHDSMYFGVPIAKLAGVPCIAGFRVSNDYWMRSVDRLLGRMYRRWNDGVVVNCKACKQVVETEGVPSEAITIIPNGVDLSRFGYDAIPTSGLASRTERRVGVVANLRPVKNLDLFLRAASRLMPLHPNVRFQIAGEGESRSKLESLIGDLNLRGCAELLGSVADIPAFLRTLDVAVLCSNSEGSPNSIMEYMAAARPVVATRVGGCGELVEHERHGLLVEPDNVEQLVAAIDRLLRDDHLATFLGANARQRAFSEFGVDSQARRYEDFYHALLEKKQRSRRSTARETAHHFAHDALQGASIR